MLRPLGNKIVVKRDEAEDRVGNILLPDSAKEKPKRGKVKAVGKGKRQDDGKLAPMYVEVGDTVLFSGYAGNEVEIDGETLLVMSEEDVLAVLT